MQYYLWMHQSWTLIKWRISSRFVQQKKKWRCWRYFLRTRLWNMFFSCLVVDILSTSSNCAVYALGLLFCCKFYYFFTNYHSFSMLFCFEGSKVLVKVSSKCGFHVCLDRMNEHVNCANGNTGQKNSAWLINTVDYLETVSESGNMSVMFCW